MDEYIFSPLEWEVQAMKDDKKIYCSIRDYDSPNTSLRTFIEQQTGANLFSLCAAKWSKYRQIYSFDRGLIDYLLKNVNVDSINSNMILFKLPFPAFYVKNRINIGNFFIEGFYVYLNRYNESNHITLEISIVYREGNKDTLLFNSFTIYLGENDEYSISKIIEKLLIDDKREEKEIKQILQAVIILITYLCTDKVDIVRRKEEYTPRNSKNKKPQKADLKLVGAKTARIIKERKTRYVYEEKEVTGDRKGKPKAAHFRSAHYHSFWTGKRDEPEKRQLIVKLLDPIFVNGTDKEIPVTNRIVVNEGRKAERNMI